MAGPTPEQMQAANAALQQTLQSMQQENAAVTQRSFPVTIQNSALSTDPATLTRALVLEGTAVGAGLDQLIMRTAQGEVVLKVQQLQEQELLNLLPSRVTLQLRPGPDGLQAVLVVGNKPVTPDKPVDSLSAGTASASNQTFTPEIPKINQIYQALVLPSSLFAARTMEELLRLLTAKPAPQVPAQGKASAPPPNQAQTLLGAVMQKLGFTVENRNAQTAMNMMPALPSGLSSPSVGSAGPALPNLPQITAIKILGVITPEVKTPGVVPPFIPVTEDENTSIAMVRGNTPSGNPILSLGDRLVAVQGGRNWPVGTQVKVMIGPGAGLVLEDGGAPEAKNWAGLRQALEVLAAQSPGLLADVARLRLPNAAASQLPGALLFLFAALQKGAPAWLGEEFTQKLKELGKEELIRQITDQWRAQINQSAEGPGGEWRGMAIPIFDQEKMQVLRFYVYDPPGERGKNRKRDPNHARRFVMDLELSRLGPIQLDGLVHKKRLDLVVRTAHAFEAALRNELTTHFNRTLEEVRYTGQLNFAANRMGWVEIREKPEKHLLKEV
ncbi:MAG: hypothetical protein HY053_07770 [Proteobacteria bacterium]|nr:hypothetical protein [Pseudomonadota bacterium]